MPQIPDHYAGGAGIEHLTPTERAEASTLAQQRYFTASEDERVVDLRDAVQQLGAFIDLLVPPGRNKALALTALEDVQMRANRGLFAPEHLR
jgi:hypothetical protein